MASFTAEDLEAYRRWAEESLGVVLHPALRLGSSPKEGDAADRGVFATAAVEECDVLVTVPWAALLKVQDVTETPFAELAGTAPGLREDDILALTLLFEKHERGAESRWSRHIEMLPEAYGSLLFWSAEEVEGLRSTNSYPTAKALLEQVPRDYAELAAKKMAPEDAASATVGETYAWFTEAAYRWALGTIWSRFVSVARPGEMPFKCMAPVFDFFNHLPSAEVAQGYRAEADMDTAEEKALVTPEGAVQILTGQAWAAGGEVFLNYGPVSNSRMVMLYGCTLGANPFDGVDVFCTMDPRAPGYVVKQEVFTGLGIDTRVQPFRVTLGRLPDTLMGALRVQRADNPSEMTPEALRGALAENTVLSEDNERLVIETLRQALAGMLEPLEALREADDATEWGADMDSERTVIMSKERMAVSVRCSERKVIASVMGLLDAYEAGLHDMLSGAGATEEKSA